MIRHKIVAIEMLRYGNCSIAAASTEGIEREVGGSEYLDKYGGEEVVAIWYGRRRKR